MNVSARYIHARPPGVTSFRKKEGEKGSSLLLVNCNEVVIRCNAVQPVPHVSRSVMYLGPQADDSFLGQVAEDSENEERQHLEMKDAAARVYGNEGGKRLLEAPCGSASVCWVCCVRF